jgi:hypothetical protein
MGAVELPPNAKREEVSNKKLQANLATRFFTTVDSSCLKVDRIAFLSLFPGGEPVAVAKGYKMQEMRLEMKNGEARAVQPLQIVHLPDGTFRLGDCGAVQQIDE